MKTPYNTEISKQRIKAFYGVLSVFVLLRGDSIKKKRTVFRPLGKGCRGVRKNNKLT